MGNKKASESLEEGILRSHLGLNKIPCNKFLVEPKSAPLCSLSENNAVCVYGCRHLKELRTINGGLQESSLNDVTVENGEISGGKICACPGDDVEKNVSTKNECEDRFGEQNGTYDEGDLVWTKTRTQTWWPGMVSDPFSSVYDATKSDKKGILLVKYFGNANFTRCEPSELKPFLEHFDKMSDQNSSRNFSGSVEKALSIIGCRIKAEMTCPCFSKENRALVAKGSTEFTEKCSVSVYKKGKVDVLSASQFQPSTFLARIQDLARSAREPGKVELTVTKNRLAAFYCSVGHHELPVQLLKSSANSEKDTLNVVRSKPVNEHQNDISVSCLSLVAPEDSLSASRRQKRNHDAAAAAAAALALDSRTSSSGKGSESREKNKSNYLSYPYLNFVNQNATSDTGQKTEELNHGSSLATKSAPLASSSGKGSWTNDTGNPFEGIVSKADNIDACSSVLLGELRRTAYEWSHLSGSKYSDSLKRFYVSFRIFSFANDIICNDAGPLLTSSSRPRLPRNNTKAEVQIGVGVVKESENEQGNLASFNYNAGCAVSKELSKTENLVAEGSKKAKKKEPDISASVKSVINSSGRDKDVDPNSIQQTCSDVPQSKPAGQGLKLPQINITAQVPDLNANHPAMTIETSPAGGTSISFSEALPEQRNDKFVSLNVNCVDQINFGSVTTMEDVRLALGNISPSPNGMFGPNQYSNINFATGCSDMKMAEFGSSFQQSINAVKSEQRKRRRMEKASEVTSGIPDLNGTASDKTSAGLPDHDNASPECKQQEKKRASSDPGGNLLLIFAPGCTLPPRETLVTTFSRFGLLKESEIQILDESTVQIPYERSTEARFAFRSLEKSKPFGEALASFKLHCEAAAPRPVKRRRNTLQVQQPILPFNLAKPVEAPDLTFMKQTVVMMKSTLEKAGDSISREMRAKLENEIKVFLDRISSMADSAS